MDKGIFISYRREDSSGYTGRLSDDLNELLTGNRIFRDIETIEPGMDFVDSINKAVDSCVVLLVVIGPRWLSVTDAAGQRRLDDPNDYNRLEIATALKRGIRVVPVLVGSATMPGAEDLPEDLKSLARRQAQELSDLRWKYDLEALIAALEKIEGVGRLRTGGEPAPKPPKKSGSRKIAYAAGGAVLLAIAAIGIGSMMSGKDDHADPAREREIRYAEGASQGSEMTGDALVETEPPVASTPLTEGKEGGTPAPSETKPTAPAQENKLASRAAEQVQEKVVTNPPVSKQRQAEPQRQQTIPPPDLEGIWVDGDGYVYEVSQAGEFIEIDVYEPMSGSSIGFGEGSIQGRRLSTSLDAQGVDAWGNVVSESFRSQLTLSSDGQRLEGTTTAQSTGLTTPVMLFRVDASQFDIDGDDSGGY